MSTTFLVACAGSSRYRTELVGHGNGMVSSRVTESPATDQVAAPGAGGIHLARGTYEIAMRFDVPRAQVIDWKLVCPGTELEGQAGETFAEYRERRLDEMRREAERERERIATATSIVVGAVAPRVQTTTRTGNTNVHVGAHVDAHAAGVATAHGVVIEPVELAPGDVGRGSVAATTRVLTQSDGVCALRATAEDPDVRASFTVTRIRDVEAEAREAAVRVRGQISARLVTQGADPAQIERRRAEQAVRVEAEARAHAEARARLELEVRARAELRARLEAQAIYARQEYLAYLSGECGAEPGRRDRIAEQERRDREARLVAYAEIAQRRDQLALQVRADLRARLIAHGAKARPPMPPPRPEEPGQAPFTGAEWQAGYWTWESGAWAWEEGGWVDPTVFGEAGQVGIVGVTVGTSTGGPRAGSRRERRDHRYGSSTRDHRAGGGSSSGAGWIETLTHSKGSPSRESTGRDLGRDHGGPRDSSRPAWEPKRDDGRERVRDHRDRDKDDDDDKKDDGPRVRDHRR